MVPPAHVASEGEYYDLSTIPERYTGYAGQDARRIWRAIYEENCFGISEFDTLGAFNTQGGLPKGSVGASESECLEQRVYYKIISGAWLTFYFLRQ